MKHRIVICAIVLFIHCQILHAQVRLVTLNTVKCRPLALGGAFTTLQDDLPALNYNPAGFRVRPNASRYPRAVYLNPLGVGIALANQDALRYGISSAGLIIRGAGIVYGRAHIGLSIGEESFSDIDRIERNGWFDAKGFETQQNINTGVSFVLAPKVSLGIATEIYVRSLKWKHAKAGFRYGIQVKPRPNLTIGLCYVDLPNQYPQERMVLERIADETLNVGFQFQPWSWIQTSVDLRNVSDEGKTTEMEPHTGIEIHPAVPLFLRGGYYQLKNREEEVFSCGIGLIDGRIVFSHTNLWDRIMIKLDATMIWQKTHVETYRWMMLSCSIVY
jgi:hypothetical protein